MPEGFLPKKGNYRKLIVYQKAECIYDITFYFANKYLVAKKDRTVDQMVQSARSAKQNIAEGSAASATSSETELKLMGVARASMKELLTDYEDYLRTRNLTIWALDDERTRQTQAFCTKHNKSADYITNIEQRSAETIANIAITLIHQYDQMMGRLMDRLQQDFVEQGGIRERMTAARLGYRNDQKTRIEELETENSRLKAKIAELEEKLKGLSPISPIGPIRPIGPMSLIGLIILCLTLVSSCGGGGSDDLGAPQTAGQKEELVPITFNGSQGIESAVTRASGTPLSEKAKQFHVWGYKNMQNNSSTQTVFPGYQVDWGANTAYTTTSNTNNWEYVGISDQTIKYWDWSAQAYRFFAVTGWTGTTALDFTKTENASKTYGTSGTNTYSVSMLANTADIKDNLYFSRLWYSTGNPTDYPDKQFGKPVTLEFLKPYARVRFVYNYVYPREGITLSDQSFKPTDGSKIARKGIVTVTYPLSGDTKESYSMNVTNPEDAAHLTAFTEDFDPENDTKIYSTCDKGWYTVIPNTSQKSYTLSVKVNNSTPAKTAVVPEEYMKWLPGYSYTYIFKINDEGGVEIGWVESAVTPWTEMEADWTVYNW